MKEFIHVLARIAVMINSTERNGKIFLLVHVINTCSKIQILEDQELTIVETSTIKRFLYRKRRHVDKGNDVEQ